MCTCQTHTAEPIDATLTFKVEDMTCGHCAGTVKSALERGLPGAVVTADPAARLVAISGTRDRSAAAQLISQAGYTPA
ncbi:copper resistance protein CopZ [Bosea sp. Root483D1]|uniref:heavy-metal-associated domain-containing protein n=1 Tax=Bosea sp. Root483D1 TaxID=1736544 RepID=UPI00070C270A|nr:heavy-metal-associated domain-containing protein [Bosea sp. Root483D1]KRE12689.1 copper resistance protein CopZ [Bosea sp. Root483D1]